MSGAPPRLPRASAPALPMSSTRAHSTFMTSTNWSATRSIIMQRCAVFIGSIEMRRSALPRGRSNRPKDRWTFLLQVPARNPPGGLVFQHTVFSPILRAMSIAAKICGICGEEAVTAAVSEGAAYLGFVFYSPSPRAVTPCRAAQLCAAIPSGIERVGLFVDADDLLLETAIAAAPLDILQFHGDETPERVGE